MPSDSERKAAKAFKRHPAAIAQDAFDKEHARAFDPSTLGTESPRTYLANRIHRAFQAGWEAAIKHMQLQQEPKP